MRKLGQKVKIEDKEEVKVEGASHPMEDDSKPQMSATDMKGKYSLFAEDKK